MAENKGCGFNWGCFLWETIFNGIILLGVIIWQADKYGSVTKAYHHWADDSWWFAPIFWIYMVILGAVVGFFLLVVCVMMYDSRKNKIKQLFKRNK